ncbi:pitrilysin family protein [Limibacter armeniacum]|uniref:M16 family metallopeptidase n=1 Tax=Limibacter armeniacum TaxID=466084 RepID=UPI002FE54966
MIQFESFTLDNGLKVVVHEDHTFPSAVLNIMYNVGSRDEEEHKTGFAHLFEHLMFGGSVNVPSYDEPLQRVGGSNNAYTSPDVTNYYVTLPAQNIETAFWLESDRMLSLSFDPNVLEVQRKVVIEEFKQRYLNQPYGVAWHKLREMSYKEHSYKWPTIGKEVSHIEDATMEDVKDFFFTHYRPNNAVLVVAGNVTLDQVKELTEKWFGPIPAGKVPERDIPKESPQTEARFTEVTENVPVDALYKVWHMGARGEGDYYATDLLSDVMGRGKSSPLYQKLVREKRLFSSLNAYITGSLDPGLFCIAGRLQQGVTLDEANLAIEELIEEVKVKRVTESELEKVKNQVEFGIAAGKSELLPRAVALAYGAIMGNPNLVNEEEVLVRKVTAEDVNKAMDKYLVKENCSTLYYKSEANNN